MSMSSPRTPLAQRALVAAACALAIGGSAVAQDATDDWDITVNPENRLTMASVDFGNSLVIAVRCQNGRLDAVIAGLPVAPGVASRQILLKFASNETAYSSSWNVAVDPSIGVSEYPAGFARNLRQGGRLDVTVPGAAEGGRNLRYALDLPTAHAAIDRTLQACGKPLVDPRDAEIAALDDTGLPVDFNWARRPRPEYPDGILTYPRGFAVVSCLSEPNGRLRACEIETEHPRDGGFGRATLDATRRARVENTAAPGQPIPLRRVMFRANYNMESEADGQTHSPVGTRTPGSRN